MILHLLLQQIKHTPVTLVEPSEMQGNTYSMVEVNRASAILQVPATGRGLERI